MHEKAPRTGLKAVSQRLRVLLATAHPRDLTLGSPKYVLRLGSALEELGHKVDYLFVEDVPNWLRDRRLLYGSFPAQVARHALRGRHDVIHVASGDSAAIGPLALAYKRRPWVLINQVLGMEHLHWKELKQFSEDGGGRLTLRHRLLYGGVRLRQVEVSIRSSDAVMCLCRQDEQFILDRGWRPPERVAVVPPGVDQIFLDSSRANLLSPTIFFLGTWTPRKGVVELVDAFARVVAKIPAARLVVAGAHQPADAVLADFPTLLRGAVNVLPTIPDPPIKLIELMQASSVGVLPSHYEGFGMAFLEMMAIGLPVVGTATGGMADLIHEGEDGFLVPRREPARLAEALLRVLIDADKRRHLADGAHRTAKAFTWRRAAVGATALYLRMLRAR